MTKLITPVLLLALFMGTAASFVVAFNVGVAHADAGSGSGSDAVPVPPTASPSDQLHDPITAPSASWDDLKAAKKIGWALAVLAFVTMAARLAGKLGGWFTFLSTGKTALVIGAGGALGAAGYDALANGGSWMSVAVTAIVAAAAYWDSHAKPAPLKAV